MGHGAHRAARALHALLSDLIHDRAAAALDRHQRELAVAARVLEGRLSRRARRAGDRVFFPFSFGPFLGFWAGFEAGLQMGLHCIPGGGMSSQIRLAMIEAVGATVVCCTPTYALRLAEIAEHERPRRPLAESTVRMLIVAGEPGGSIPADARAHRAELGRARDRPSRADRSRARQLRVLGGAGVSARQRGRVHLRGARPGDRARGRRRRARRARRHQSRPYGQPGHPLPHRRHRRPAARRRARADARGRASKAASSSRADDMVNIRGVNVYPVGIETVVRRFAEVVEFRSIVSRRGAMRSLRLEIEVAPAVGGRSAIAARVAYHLREALGLTRACAGRRRWDAAAVRDEGQPIRRRSIRSHGQQMRIPSTATSPIAGSNPDVVVIGGGPAGSTVSTLLAQQGVSVELFERERFPRFHIGESLIPETYWVLKRLDMLPKMQAEPLRQEVQRAVRELGRARSPRRSTSGTTSRTSARRRGRWCAASSTR